MTRNRNAAQHTQPARTASAPRQADGRPPARGASQPVADGPARRGRGLLRRLALAALAAFGLAAGASAQAGLSATTPTSAGAYTVSWTAITGATKYQLLEGGTEVYKGATRSKSFTGKAAGSYKYTLTYCLHIPYPSPQTVCNLPSTFTALTVTVPEATATPAPAAPTLTVPATNTDGSYKVTWTRPTGATSYQLEEKANTGSWGSAYSGESNSKSFTNKGTAVYAYRVKACAGASNCSGWSSEGSVRVTRAASTVTASPNPATYGNYTVRWTASNLGSYVLKESVDGGTAKTVQTGTGRSKRFTGKAPGSYAYSLEVCFSLLGSRVCVPSGSVTVTVPEPSGSISASPSPCVFATGQTRCSTTVKWSTQNAATPCVFVQHSEAKFACTRSGSKAATWIRRAGATFVLKAGNTFASETLASVTVKGVGKPTASARFSPAKINLGQSSTLSWSSTDAESCSGSRALGSTNPSGTKTFEPSSAGAYSVKVTCTGAGGNGSATATVSVNASPDAVDDTDSTDYETAVTVEVLANDSDPESSTLRVLSASDPANGATVVNNERTVTYTPDGGYSGTDSFTYTITDGMARDSATVTVTVGPPPTGVPSAPAEPTVTATSASSLKVTWTAPDSPGSDIDDYDVQYRKNGETTWQDHAFTGTGTSTTISGLDPYTDYEVEVRAHNDSGEGPWSEAGTARTLDVVPDAPAAPTVTATDASSLKATWTAPTSRGSAIDDYNVQYRKNGATGWTGHAFTGTGTSTTISGLNPSTGYEVQVRAGNGAGHSPWSQAGTATTPADTNRAPVASDDRAATLRGESVAIDVLANDTDADAGDTLTVASATTPANGTATITANGTMVTYKPKAAFLGTDTFNYTVSDGTATASATVSVEVGRFIAVPNPSADGSYTVKWAALAGASGYMLREDAAATYLGANRSHGFSNKARGSYAYTLMKCIPSVPVLDCGTDSGYGELRVQVGEPLPAAPAGLAATPNPSADGSFQVSWSASAGATRYELEQRVGRGAWSGVRNGAATQVDLTGRSITGSTPYQYRVRACDGAADADCGDWSDELAVAVTGALWADPNPSTDGAYAVRWTPSLTASGYKLEESVDGGANWSSPIDVTGSQRAFTGKGDGTYTYRVRGCLQLVLLDRRREVCTPLIPGQADAKLDVTVARRLAPPTLAVTPEVAPDGAYRVSWGTSTGATSYVAQERTDGGSWSNVTGASGRAKRYAGRGAAIYGYQVRACATSSDCGAWSPVATVRVPPAVPAGLTVPSTDSDGSYTVSWTASTGADRYVLEEDDGSGAWAAVAKQAADALTSRAITKAADGTYAYRVKACKGDANCSAPGSPRNVAVLRGTGAAGISAPAVSSGSHTVTWSELFAGASHTLKESTDGGRTWTDHPTGATRSKSFTNRAVNVYTYDVEGCITISAFDIGEVCVSAHERHGWAYGVTRVPPLAPANLTSTAPDTNRSYTVSWDASTGAGRYVLEESGDGGSTWSEVAKQASDGAMSRAVAKAADGTFAYRVKACQGTANCGSWSPSFNVTVEAPSGIGVPVGFAVDAMGPDEYTLEWEAVASASRYELERSVNGARWANVHSASARSKAYRNEPNGAYRYRVRACPMTGDCGKFAGPVSVTVPIPTPVPRNLRISTPDAQGRHTVSWDPVPFGSGILYFLDQTHRNNLRRYTVPGTSRTLPAPTPGDYAYRVKACIGFSDCSDETARVTVAVPPGRVGAVTLPGTCVGGEHTLKWPAVTGADRYELQRQAAGGGWTPDYAGAKPATTLPLSAGTSYKFQARACVGTENCGAWSATATLTPMECARLDAPTGLLVEATDPDDFSVRWDAVNGAARYELQESKDGGATWPTTHEPTKSEKAFTGQAAGTYQYRVRACPAAGDCSDWSDTVDLTVPIPPPAPEGLAATAPDDGAYTVSWDAVSFGSNVTYALQERTGSGNWSDVHDGTATSKAVTGKTGGIYEYQVKACAGTGNCGDWSGSLSVTVGTLSVETPPAPFNAQASLVTTAEQADTDETGSLPGAFRVTESGAASYTVPVYAVRGTAGVTPELALTYNSQAGNGPAGLGWTVDGMSAISRCRATRHQDAVAKPIQWNAEDKFCLDGQRLVLDSGTYGSPNSTYRTEIDSFARIKALGGTAGHPDYFEVRRKDGSVSHYGKTPGGTDTDAKQQNGTGQTLKWAVKRFADSVGNPIVYVYSNDASGHRLAEVRYAYGSSRDVDQPHAKIELVHEDRADAITGYVAGHKFASAKRVKTVRTHNHNGSALAVVRELRLGYADVGARLDKTSRLTSIKECAGSAPTAPCLNPTTFDWQAGTAGFRSSYTEAQLTPRGDRGVLNYHPADVNGDGLLDLVWLEWDVDSGGDTDHHLKYALSNGTNLVQASFDTGAASVELHDDVSTVQEVVVRTIDYNGDGRADAAVWRQRDPVWRVHLSTPQATGGWKLSATPVATTLVTKHADFSDINGDGLLDAVYTRGKTIYARYLEKDATQPLTSGRYYAFGAEAALYTRKPAGNVVVPGQSIGVEAANHDFNGDGRADLIATFRTSILGGSVGVTKRPFVIGADGTWTAYATFSDYDVHPADLNRDGLTDLIREQRSAAQGRTLQVAINTGSGFASHALAVTLSPEDNDILPPIDYNGDGHPDFVWHDRNARRIKAYFWDPSTNAFAIPTVPHTVRTTDGEKKRAHLFFDANGDGHTDYVHLTDLNDKGKLRTYLSNDTGRKPGRITTIGNGLGAVTEIDYETLSTTDHYERLDVKRVVTPTRFCLGFLGTTNCVPYGNPIDSDVETTDDMGRPLPDQEIASRVKAKLAERTAAFYKELNSGWNLPSGAQTLGKVGPVLEFTGPVDVVTRVDSSAPKAGAAPGAVIGGAKSAIEYFYADAKVQAMGRGLLGFGQLMTKDMQTAVETTTAYRHDFPFTGLPVKTTVRTAAERVLSESITTWKLTGYRSTWAATAQRSGTAALGAFRPHASKAVEKTFDLISGSNDDPALLTTVTTDSVHDADGNLTSSTVTTVGGGKTFATATANTYGPSDADRQTGRLTRTVVTHSRDTDGDGTPETAARRSDFSYYGQAACPVTSAAYAGLLCEETVEPARPADKVVTTHYYDAFGNRNKSRVVAGSGTDRITRCDHVTATYDSRGRFVETTADCEGRKTSEVMERDAHGTPTSVNRHTSASGADYVTETAATTPRGLVYFERSATGAHTLTTRKNGAHGQCPTGTAFHERVRPGGGGESVSCFDVLARKVRTATTGFAAGSWVHVDTEYDGLGRVKRTSEPHYSTETGCAAGGGNATPKSRCWTEFDYDILGRVTQTTLPDGSTASAAYAGLTTTRTNALKQRRTETVNALGETVGTSDHLGATVAFSYDTQGNLTSVERAKASSDASAAPARVTTTMAYDLLGRRTGMTDPDKGAWSYRHNALGELVCQRSAAGHTTRMAYDGLGRLAMRRDYRSDTADCDRSASGTLEADAAWTYDASPGGLGQLASVTDSVTGYHKALTYDRKGRPSTTETRPGTGNGSHFEKTTYDQHGRVFQIFDAARATRDFTDHGVRYVYNGNGYLERLQDAVGTAGAGGTFTPRAVYRTVTAMDARGNVTAETLGNGISRNHAYDGQTGRVRAVRSGLGMARNRQDLAYDWDVLGNLSQRERTRSGTTLTEEFCYDNLNRLTRSRLTTEAGARAKDLCDTPPSQLAGIDTVAYDGYGNIHARSGVGTYAYGAGGAGPHAVTSITKAGHPNVTYAYDANGNNTSGDGRTIAYTAFDKPKSIVKGSHTTTFAYGPDRTRFKRTDTNAQGTTTTLYVGSVERITRPSGHVQIKRHIGGIAIETVGSADGGCDRSDAKAIQYVLRDHLGSVDVLTDAGGSIDRDMRFDPWGWRAAPSTGEPLADSAAKAYDHCETTRGFTGHEMLDEVGIVHMNGRIYDPRLARFLQADPVVQFPNDLQSHNRYSYVLNNPLAYTDPSGLFLKKLIRPLAAIAISIWMPGAGFWTGSTLFAANGVGAIAVSGFVAGGVASGSLKGAVTGAFTAAAFAGVGSAFEGRFLAADGAGAFGTGLTASGLALKSAAHGIVGGVMGALQGGRFGHGFLSGFVTQAAAGRIDGLKHGQHRVLAAAVLGGTVSAATGGKFANGAITGAFSRAFNDELHKSEDQEPSIEDSADYAENWILKGRHEYVRMSDAVCSTSQAVCTLANVVEALNAKGAYPEQDREFVPGQDHVADVDIWGPFGMDQVRTTALYNQDGSQIGVMNTTIRNHALWPGKVYRIAIPRDGAYHILTLGLGQGRFGIPNVRMKNVTWDPVDRNVTEQFQR